MPNLRVNIAGVEWSNPVTTASGTFGFGDEYGEYFDLSKLGAVCVKALSAVPRLGNPSPRIAETSMGILNSVGLQNPGVDYFKENYLVKLRKYDTKIIANLCGSSIDDYVKAAEMLGDSVDMIELNISCPNVKTGGMAFGTQPDSTAEITKAVKNVVKCPLIVKLSPNVTDICEIAKAAESAGADALSMINTLMGMKIDIHTRKPVLKNNTGGLSGPAVKPVAVRMVSQVYHTVDIPIIGMGGISNADDAIEFMLAGASAVAIGTAGFVNPYVWVETVDGIEKYLADNNIENVSDIVGQAELY